MKRNLLIWLCLWILSVVGISFFGGFVSYGFFTMLTLIPLISLTYLLYVYYFFHIFQKVDKKYLVAKQTYPFYFSLVNDYHILFSGIRVEFYSDFSKVSGLDEKTEYEFLPKTGITEQTGIVFNYCGEYKVGIKNVIIQDFFRLFSFSYTNPEPLKVKVRPQIVKLVDISNVDTSISYKDSSTNGAEMDVLVRDYVTGDDIRQVHWNASAKCGKLMIRKKIGQQLQGFGLLLSTYKSCEDIKTYLRVENKMLEIAIAINYLFAGKDIEVTNYINSLTVKEYSVYSLKQFDGFYNYASDILFEKRFSDETFFENLIHNQRLLEYKSVFIIVNTVSDALRKMLSNLNLNGVKVIVYIVSNEAECEYRELEYTNVSVVPVNPEDDLMGVM